MINITYINLLMADINGLTDDIYESLVDSDIEQLNRSVDTLIKILKDVKKINESNQTDIGPV